MLIAASAAAGTALAAWTENAVFTLPAFVWTLLVGAVPRNGLALTLAWSPVRFDCVGAGSYTETRQRPS